MEIAFQKYHDNAHLKSLHYTEIKPLREWKEVVDAEIEAIKRKLNASKGIEILDQSATLRSV